MMKYLHDEPNKTDIIKLSSNHDPTNLSDVHVESPQSNDPASNVSVYVPKPEREERAIKHLVSQIGGQ